MATHSSSFAWKIPWTIETGVLQSLGLQKSQHDLVSKQTKAVKTILIKKKKSGGSTVPDFKTYYKDKIIKIM